ncbi:LysR family transcriptional regulator [Azospirillum sp. YIM B02556]|uniref:LysR family transcriptional regulator n=1 Tax=Azospirillum endophyticum TaxID=2800326 RepID=A0ABS1FFP4_9PROT|nr:LysR substrate-binding domain-containing protein [Azospirillum endophyticum]MBK1842235.1 LysR family transcriptional regulator [Azospirillum endophyticum]
MNVRQIEAFQAVMASGSVTRAGERLSISQPAVSQLIAQFERSCGFRLFNRQGSKITPTREAEALYNEVQRMFIGVGQIARVATALRDQNWGSVSVGAFPAIARRVLPEIVWSFCEAHPDMRFRLESMRSRSLIDAVAAQHVDFGLSILPGDRPEVVSTHLHRLRGVCILPAGHPLAERHTIHAHDLADEDFVSLGPQDHSRFMIDRVFDELKVARRSRIEAGQSETAFSFVAAKAGVAVVDPISAFNNEDARIAVRRFEPAVEFDIWLIRPKAARSFNLVDSFVAFTLERLDVFATTLSAT